MYNIYDLYIKEITNMMFSNLDFSYNRSVFSDRARKIGEDIYKNDGADGLFNTMDILVKTFNKDRYLHKYLEDLRELECCWSGICSEFQA